MALVTKSGNTTTTTTATKTSFKVSLSVFEKGKKAPQWNLTSDLDGQQSLADFFIFTKVSLLEIANEALREEQGKGFDKNPVVEVDGRTGVSELSVKPLGKIHYIARQAADDMLEFALEGILQRSPVLTGAYKAAHVVLYNFKPVATNVTDLKAFVKKTQFKDKDSIIILNTVPYARKLERLGVSAGGRKQARKTLQKVKKGFVGPRRQVNQANGAYYLTYRAVLRKYKNNIKVNFKFLPGHYFQGAIGKHADVTSHRFKGRKQTAKSPQTYLYPCLFFTFQAAGAL